MLVGVLALQGDYSTHAAALQRVGISTKEIRTPGDAGYVFSEGRENPEILAKDTRSHVSLDGIVVPGGESSTFDLLGRRYGLDKLLRTMASEGKTIFGTCAGAIWLGKGQHHKVTSLGLIDVEVTRNAYGRQIDSFIAPVDVRGLDEPFEAVFIRAPKLQIDAEDVTIYAEYNSDPIFVRQGNIWLTTFHPERTEDTRIHKLIFGLS